MEKTKPSCFVIMPFNKDFDNVYSNCIKPLIKSRLGMECVRIDEWPSSKMTIIDNIKASIKHCLFAIADITQPNPNVFYEVGFAHAMGKDVIFIKNKQLGNLPFDISSWHVIVYDGDSMNNEKMFERIVNMIRRDFPNEVKIPKVKKMTSSDSIIGKWKGIYFIEKEVDGSVKNIKHDVALTIIPRGRYYEATCEIIIDEETSLIENLMYHNRLTGSEWKSGKWIEFIGTDWKNTNNYLMDYWLDAYAINKQLQGDKLRVKIWDNVNKDKQDVLFEKIK